MFSRIPNLGIVFTYFFSFFLKQSRILILKSYKKNVAITICFRKKDFLQLLQQIKKSWYRRFGIREKMSRRVIRIQYDAFSSH